MLQPLTKTKGALHMQGLHEPVDVITDRYGVPHIYAQNEDDLYFAQGFVHAQERLWPMEFNRRLGSGQLAEIFGEVALEIDRFTRRLGLHRASLSAVEHIPEYNRRILEAYAQGVNEGIDHNRNKLPIEFTLLRFKPTPWRITDSIQWSKMMGWNLSGNWETEGIRARIIASLGAERAANLEADYNPSHPLIIPPAVEYRRINSALLEQYQQLKQLSGFGTLGASNNWEVDGPMTITG